MSVIQKFNQLGGTIATRKSLETLRDNALLENPTVQNTELLNRVEHLLESYPDAQEFELQLKKPIKEFSSLAAPSFDSLKKVENNSGITYTIDGKKVAEISKNGVLQWYQKGLGEKIRKTIRKKAHEGLGVCESMLHGLECISESDNESLGKPVSPNDIYNYITDLILNTIKEVGHLPWQKEWVGSGSEGVARNYVSKKPYSGANFILNFDIKFDKKGKPYLVPIKFKQPYYLTFNQIKEAKATLKKGSVASRVIYYTMIFGFDNGTQKIKTSDRPKYTEFIQNNGFTKADIAEHGSKIPVIKYYNVYRADDCTGLVFGEKPKPKNTTPIEEAQSIIDGYPNPPKFTFGGDGAYYQPANDLVNMPKISAFNKEAFYYCTYFHELIHSTGHSKRLDRGNDTRKRDGSIEDKKAYAFEELVAELGAVFLCSESGLLFTTRNNSAKYLHGWNSRLVSELENDNRFFLKASAKAQKAADWILDRNEEDKDQKKTKKPAKKVAKPVVKKPIATNKEVVTKKVNVQKKTKNVTKKPSTVTRKPSTVTKSKVVGMKVATKRKVTPKKITEAEVKKRTETGKQLTLALAKPIEVLGVPVYINSEPDQVTNDIIQAAIETMPLDKIVVHQPEPVQEVEKPTNKLMEMQFDSLPMDEGWENFMQNPAKNLKIGISGQPKNGKTAGSLQLANYLTKFGNVLYNFADQGFNKSTQDLWIMNGLAENEKATPSDITTLADLEKEIATGKYQFVFIDMINDYIDREKITPQEFKDNFVNKYSNVGFVLVLEATKAGSFKGDNKWMHVVDAIATVEDFMMKIRGRYGMGEKVIWEEGFKKFNPKAYEEWLQDQEEEIQLSEQIETI